MRNNLEAITVEWLQKFGFEPGKCERAWRYYLRNGEDAVFLQIVLDDDYESFEIGCIHEDGTDITHISLAQKHHARADVVKLVSALESLSKEGTTLPPVAIPTPAKVPRYRLCWWHHVDGEECHEEEWLSKAKAEQLLERANENPGNYDYWIEAEDAKGGGVA